MSSFHIGELHVRPEEKENLIASFGMLHEQAGFVGHQIYVSDDDVNHLTTVEEWISAEDHAAFMSSMPAEAFEQWVAMLTQPPKGNFFKKIN